MAIYTVKIAKVCSGGEHIDLDVYKDGVKIRMFSVTRPEILQTDNTWEDILKGIASSISLWYPCVKKLRSQVLPR
jgi:hypothetical protein